MTDHTRSSILRCDASPNIVRLQHATKMEATNKLIRPLPQRAWARAMPPTVATPSTTPTNLLVVAPPEWRIYTPEHRLPWDLYTNLSWRVALGHWRSVRFHFKARGQSYQVWINTKEQVTVVVRRPEERGECSAP